MAKLNELQKKVLEFVKWHDGFAKVKTDALLKELSINTDLARVGKIVNRIYGGNKYSKELSDYLMAGTIDVVSIGAGVKIRGKQKVNSFKAWYTEHAYSPYSKGWSETINDLNRVDEIAKSIRQSIAQGKSARTAAQVLHDKGIQGADVAKDVQRLLDKSRTLYALSDNSDGYIAFKKQVETVQRRINTLVRPDKSKLKRAYQDVLDLTNKSTAAQIDNAIKYTSYFKERYNAERIARTEMSRAYGDAATADAIYNDDVIGIQFMLSSSHPKPDICDLHTGADLYGMGAGVYPKNYAPEYPFHPHCVLPGNRVWFEGKLVGACQSFYSGIVKKIRLASGKELAVTVNHPILTDKGWVKAGEITEGINIISCKYGERPTGNVLFGLIMFKPYNNNRPSRIEEIFSSFKKSGQVTSVKMPMSIKDFHGDGEFIDSYINVINPNGLLLSDIKPSFFKHFCKLVFCGGNIPRLVFNSFCSFCKIIKRPLAATNSIMSFFSHFFSKFWSSFRKSQFDAFGHRTPLDISFYKLSSDNIARNPENVRKCLFRLSSDIALDKCVSIKTFDYNGHVYDLQVEPSEIYIANGVIVKNCLCAIVKVFEGEADPATKADYNPKGGKKFLSGLSAEKQKQIIGVSGAEKFSEKPGAWETIMEKKGYNGQEVKKPKIPKKVLYEGN